MTKEAYDRYLTDFGERLEAATPPPHRRRGWVVGAVIVAAALAVGLGLTLGGSSSVPARALAIEKTPKWVTLRLTNPNATDAQMNQELADAGIDGVRVISVPGPPQEQPHPYWGHDSVGTWAGYVELGPRCQGGPSRFGYDVDIPISTPYNRANRHGAEDLFDLTLPRHSGALTAEEVGTPFSRSTVRLPAKSVDDPRNAAKVLVPVRPRSPDDGADANDIGADQLGALGGVFAEYGEAVQSGHTSCSDFGLKPYPPPKPFPPPHGWVDLRIGDTEAAAQRMTHDIRAGGIDGELRLVPAVRREVGSWLGFIRRPPLPANRHARGNQFDIGFHDAAGHVTAANGDYVSLRRAAFNAYPKARWVFYVGRKHRDGEKPKVMGPSGLEVARVVKAECVTGSTLVTPHGHRSCASAISAQVPPPARGR